MQNPMLHPNFDRITTFLKSKIPFTPDIGIVLGSGLGAVAGAVTSEFEIPYDQIPGFVTTQIPGHAGRLIVGHLDDKPVILFSGRIHYYEGYDFSDVTLLVQTVYGLGAKAVALSCAVGGINPTYRPGDFMLAADHINLQGTNPLFELLRKKPTGAFSGAPSPFVDMTNAYRTDAYESLVEKASALSVNVHKGVLCAVTGPVYETLAEVKMMQTFGADAVCMSTVPETIVARYLGLDVCALCLITNTAHLPADQTTTHAQVLETSAKRGPAFVELMKTLVAGF
jgi:purine-nucleoside phosphorylase